MPAVYRFRGAGQKNRRTPPRTFAKSQTHPPTIRLFFPLELFLVRFWAFLGKGSSKIPLKCFCKKSMSKTFPKKIDKDFDVSFSSTFFVLSRFRGFLSDGGLKTHKKTFCKKHRVEKFLQKIRPKIQNQNRFFLDFFNHVVGRFSVRGVQKHDKKISGK
jgi:hypothetical protein